MKLSETQIIFTRNIGCLISYAYEIGIDMTFGEAHRTRSQIFLNYFGYDVINNGSKLSLKKRKRTSRTLQSKHEDRLAVDFNFFIDGKLTYDFHKIKELGDYWVSLHPNNVWGGDFNKNGVKDGFVDVPHFQMNR